MDNRELLKIDGLALSFGGHQVLCDVTCHQGDGEILGLIGPNGAGKTCVLNGITVFYKPQQGRIFFDGKDITLRIWGSQGLFKISNSFRG
jgi:branched-chain amino acid transport system ATP-binding protein